MEKGERRRKAWRAVFLFFFFESKRFAVIEERRVMIFDRDGYTRWFRVYT